MRLECADAVPKLTIWSLEVCVATAAKGVSSGGGPSMMGGFARQQKLLYWITEIKESREEEKREVPPASLKSPRI